MLRIHHVLYFLQCFMCILLTLAQTAHGQWQSIYRESFEQYTNGTKTQSKQLSHWEGGSAAGVVFDGHTKSVGKFLVAQSAWTSFNQGPILNLDLSPYPHDKVKVRLKLFTFGDWRGLQAKTGGPQHRLMFFDNRAVPSFSFDSNFSTNVKFRQSWPKRNPAQNKALTGSQEMKVDQTGRFAKAHVWDVEFEYPSQTNSLRFAILCGAGAGSGKRMPHFGIDDVEVWVRSTAPTIKLVDSQIEMRLAKQLRSESVGSPVHFQLNKSQRVSLGIFRAGSDRLVRTLLNSELLSAGDHQVVWDGLNNRGQQVPNAEYQWRLLANDGLKARYITTVGINPPGGEHPVPRRSWVGDHLGAGIVDADETGIYVGSPITEGMMMLAKVNKSKSKVMWAREQFYEGGRLTKAATSGRAVFLLHPTGKLRRLHRDNGTVEKTWQIAPPKHAPVDLDAFEENLVVVDQTLNQLRWLSSTDGSTLAKVSVSNPAAVAARSRRSRGDVFVASGNDLFIASPTQPAKKVATMEGAITALDFDPIRQELWLVVNRHRVIRLDQQFRVTQTYSDQPREWGTYDPRKFAEVYDISSDLQGGFFIGEPSRAPRRVAHIDREGKVINQWFGGMSFYVNAVADPADPTILYGIAPEGSVNVYRLDLQKGSWQIIACYRTGRLGDSLFPDSGSYKAVRRQGDLFLYHRVIPSVIRLEPKSGRVIPVAIAGKVLNRGRTFFQFAGTGREGYPRPWVAAAEHHGYHDLKQAPELFSWADQNGNGQFEAEEFQFYPEANGRISFHNPGDYSSNGDYLGTTGINAPHAIVHLPVSRWEGPRKLAPRWDWNKLKTQGKIVANSYGYGSPRGLSIAPNGSLRVAYQAGIMIREHGQYEGGGWPEAAMRGSRILGFDSQFNPQFEVGRQSKLGDEANTGVLYYPMQTATGPQQTLIVNDQTKQSAQVWTHDGLYVGGVLKKQVGDQKAEGFYGIHGDDNQGVTCIVAKNNKVYWLSPYQAHNRLYEIVGWNHWRRQTGKVSLPNHKSIPAGDGLLAQYFQGNSLVHETIEPVIYYERFKAERHADKVKPNFKVVWTGSVKPQVTDKYRFSTVLGNLEQIAIWIDGKVVYARGFEGRGTEKNIDSSIDLTRHQPHQIRIEYINPTGPAELNLLWSSRVLDPRPLPKTVLYPTSENARLP